MTFMVPFFLFLLKKGASMGYTQYPNNSTSVQPVNQVPEKTDIPVKPKIAPVANGEIVKPSFIKRTISEIFPAPKDNKTIAEHIWFDGFVPFIKSAILDTTGRMLYGESMQNSFTGAIRNAAGNVAYSAISTNMRQAIPMANQNQPNIQQTINNVTTIDQIIFQNEVLPNGGIEYGRTKAERVLATMCDIISQYRMVTVNDYYELSGKTPGPYTNASYGWTDLTGADIHENMWNGDCYIILPPARPISR